MKCPKCQIENRKIMYREIVTSLEKNIQGGLRENIIRIYFHPSFYELGKGGINHVCTITHNSNRN